MLSFLGCSKNMHIRKMIFAAASAVACAAAFAQAARPEAEIKLEPYRKTIAMHATVAGKEGFFSFDTGGGISLLTPAFAQQAGLKPWGRLNGFTMTGKQLGSPHVDDVPVSLDGHEYRAASMGIYDVAGLFEKNNTQPIDGNLALDIFDGKAITIDFPHWKLTVESPDSLKQRVAGAIELPARLTRESQGRALSVSVGVPTAQGTVWMELDSGNGGTVLVAKPYTRLFQLDPDHNGFQPGRIELAKGLTLASDHFIAADITLDGNIGMPFLKDVALTLDLKAGRAWVRPAQH